MSVFVVVAATLACAGAGPALAECAYPTAGGGCESEDGQSVTALRALVKAHHGSSYAHPGFTKVELVSTPEAAFMTATEAQTRTHVQWLTEEAEGNTIDVPWDCRHPYQTFRYTLTARGHIGETITTKLVFHAQLSARWCAAAKAREEAKRLAAEREHEAELREAARREADRPAAERHETERRETSSTCTNGTYVNSAGNTVCKPEESSTGPPAGATAECADGTYSFSESRSGTCSSHGGVVRWL